MCIRDSQKRVKKIIREKWVTKTKDKADNKTDEDKDKTLSGKMSRMGKRLKGHMKEGDYWKLKGTTRRRKE